MVDQALVAVDVGITIRRIVVDNTPFTYQASGKEAFSFALVPSAALWKGWRSNRGAWHILLSMIVQALRSLRPEYSVLDVTLQDVVDTLDAPLTTTRDLLVARIVKELAALAGPSTDA